ncbi:transcription initiation protein SPT3 homolog [Pectinophora gossypiella]|uniref:Transcription initiation protein SPT3 homolog n=1 Tax=Pectinophora gossypiella TaxID=13191 RepID=A0A1E1WSF9_PECGO|nr:transcription initiation protein SPT3 homolog [Pectinophora gossypiella]
MVSYFTVDGTGENTNFQKEISNMMHGFGDNPNPNAATVVLVENVVLQQLKSMLQEASHYAVLRGSKTITNFEIIYLMRKNKMKLKRLHDYQIKMDVIDKNRQVNVSNPTEPIISGIMLEDEKDPMIKKRRTHIDVIRELDEADEVGQIKFDVIDYLRKVRANKITESMCYDKYEAYHKARCSSFRTSNNVGRGFVKLERWINPTKELKLTIPALEVLCFVAYETVAEIVDAVFLIRQDAKKKYGDPFSKFEGGYFCNPMSLNNAVYIKSGFEGVPAITVAEVREVLRRYFNPRTGMNGLFYRNMNLELPSRYIAI